MLTPIHKLISMHANNTAFIDINCKLVRSMPAAPILSTHSKYPINSETQYTQVVLGKGVVYLLACNKHIVCMLTSEYPKHFIQNYINKIIEIENVRDMVLIADDYLAILSNRNTISMYYARKGFIYDNSVKYIFELTYTNTIESIGCTLQSNNTQYLIIKYSKEYSGLGAVASNLLTVYNIFSGTVVLVHFNIEFRLIVDAFFSDNFYIITDKFGGYKHQITKYNYWGWVSTSSESCSYPIQIAHFYNHNVRFGVSGAGDVLLLGNKDTMYFSGYSFLFNYIKKLDCMHANYLRDTTNPTFVVVMFDYTIRYYTIFLDLIYWDKEYFGKNSMVCMYNEFMGAYI